MPSPSDHATGAHRLSQTWGLQWPARRHGPWLLDAHMLAALAAGLAAWLLLGFAFGDRLYTPRGALAWLGFALTRPVLEELAFRGLLQGQLLRWTGRRVAGLSLANLLASGFFAAAHLAAQPPAWAMAVFAPSLLFGHLRERFRSVVPPIVLHAVYNAGFGLAGWLGQRYAG